MNILLPFYILALIGMSCYGFLGLVTLAYFWPHRNTRYPCPAIAEEELPDVTVQLPFYNERFVADRLVHAAAKLDYPAAKLQIQLLDDSTDETTERLRTLAQLYQERGLNITLHHRTHRTGYKAGALAAGMESATGQFIAFFDADFDPPADFLRRTIPHFTNAPELGVLQARWTHINQADSILTAAQAIAIDKHFVLDQAVRHYADLLPKFNGAAGIWRRQCLESAGGWEGDTVTEDLCLSIRAVLQGWQFRFLQDVTAPAEIPDSLMAYKSQQARWATGAMQCLQKFGGAILRSQRHPLAARLYALFTMAGYVTQLFMILVLLAQLPLILLAIPMPPILLIFSLAGIGQPLLFFLSQKILYPDWLPRMRYFPALILIAAGMAASNSRAIISAWLQRKVPFLRTPKKGDAPDVAAYKIPFDWIIIVELALSLYALTIIAAALYLGSYGMLALALIAAPGFGYVGAIGLWETFLAAKIKPFLQPAPHNHLTPAGD